MYQAFLSTKFQQIDGGLVEELDLNVLREYGLLWLCVVSCDDVCFGEEAKPNIARAARSVRFLEVNIVVHTRLHTTVNMI